MNTDEIIQCACGCGTTISRYIDYGGRGNKSQIRERKFAHGHNKPWKGKHIYTEMKAAIARYNREQRVFTQETLDKKRRSMIGKNVGKKSWCAGTTGLVKQKRGKESPLWRGGRPKCKICGQKLGHANTTGLCINHSVANKRELHYNWKGGITPENVIIRTSKAYMLWRKNVIDRDNYTCQECGLKSGNGVKVYLHADHIKPFSIYKDLRFDVSNGRTLCKRCHEKTPTYGGRLNKKTA